MLHNQRWIRESSREQTLELRVALFSVTDGVGSGNIRKKVRGRKEIAPVGAILIVAATGMKAP